MGLILIAIFQVGNRQSFAHCGELRRIGRCPDFEEADVVAGGAPGSVGDEGVDGVVAKGVCCFGGLEGCVEVGKAIRVSSQMVKV